MKRSDLILILSLFSIFFSSVLLFCSFIFDELSIFQWLFSVYLMFSLMGIPISFMDKFVSK